ncbi:uncharacterized protein LACBIDRAFT_336009 [Laccaria bicolor S238N-H82]|uniref:Predicted protein n=1 Tax=Laccaria bicolor (strain S238N-H82 / ATCC MYA-4686) TaxID=486041 RepID=B0DD84_LACBS|nr:uncharacterized protein LACBIDRAFT_327921 [Laccaria bicolor S238N-H82]XP_001890970.1 uncharacterized protein LACBIDRAFT_336009 [Laccaria bicolor S238N-H82]EDQ98382.1 predicted protein [Laccaria bicolor S238N-H82]EDR07562.1 predicted protein [Laccaria bicolor S238N-H82]|eukprot:XP_001881954.1 predicted protein [Laccaria bicolor S238N-H82]
MLWEQRSGSEDQMPLEITTTSPRICIVGGTCARSTGYSGHAIPIRRLPYYPLLLLLPLNVNSFRSILLVISVPDSWVDDSSSMCASTLNYYALLPLLLFDVDALHSILLVPDQTLLDDLEVRSVSSFNPHINKMTY